MRESVGKAPKQTCRDAILNSFYVDDFLGGASSPDEALSLYKDITTTLASRGMSIRKWASNSKQVMNEIPVELHLNKDFLLLKDDHSIKTLGLNWTPQTDILFSCIRKKTDSEHSTALPHAVKTENSTKFDEKHRIHDFSILAQVDPMVNFQAENDKVKIGTEGQKWSRSHPQACPLQTGQQKKQKYKKCNFSPITKNGPMVNIPITFHKEKVKLHTQTFDKPHENGCPIDLPPKQASYSELTQNYDTSKNHSDGHIRTNFSNTNQQNIVANNTPIASPFVSHAKTRK